MMSDNSKIIKQLLYGAKVKQVDIAAWCETSPQHVNQVVKGKRPTRAIQCAIAAAVKVPVSVVFPDNAKTPAP